MAVDRRTFVKAAGGAAAGVLASRMAGGQAGQRPPNVIFAFADEHRWQSLSFTEAATVRTPHLARLASEGLQFSHCISNYPVCSPWRGIFMSGRWPYQQGVLDNNIALQPNETIGHAFQRAGYRTAYVGKWHLGGTRAEPFGFERSLIWGNTNDHWHSKYFPADGEAVDYDGYNAVGMTDQAIEFMREHRAEPFFLTVSWNPPHAKFTDPPESLKTLYPDAETLPQRPNAPANPNGQDGDALGARWPAYQGYHAHVTAIDQEMGRLMAELDALGLAENTLLVYSSDHGSMLGSQGVGGKRQPFEESIRVPFIARWPNHIPAGATSDSLFGTIDIPPTLCAMAGVDVPGGWSGQSFAETLRGQAGPEPECQLLMHIAKDHASGGQNHPAPLFRGVTTGRHTYCCYPDRPWCLFDNAADPYQLKNRLDDPAEAATIERLRGFLAAGLKAAEDPFVMPD